MRFKIEEKRENSCNNFSIFHPQKSALKVRKYGLEALIRGFLGSLIRNLVRILKYKMADPM